ncbi:MAG TPA: phosphatidylserine/phosphatidylglycerophosphate/cardiolipin synthase family protein, partial [Rhodanobacteraceae bacterium]|nr:phosphatidylserine/phosphatidylglycerophosphate/cardiolipin synthase family protein [Rhodanobacteraceae bacterium]
AATAAAAQDRVLTCAGADACAADSPFRELAARAQEQSTPAAPVHYVNLLEQGADALALRVHLIRSARRSIEIQTFIFAEDDAGYLIIDELVKAARRGVRVRVIVDQLFSLDDPTFYATLARAHANFELRVYNPTFHKASTPPLEFAAGVLCCFLQVNQRMHNKLLLVDDAVGVAGGRNYQDRYYDWDDEFDYRDRDVLVAGPAAAQMRDSFDAFWNYRGTVALSRLRDVAADILAAGISAPPYALHAYRHAERVAAVDRKADDAEFIRTQFVARALRVGRVDYFADAPGKPQDGDGPAENELGERIMGLVAGARSRVMLQTPYLVLSGTARDVFAKLRKSQPGVRVVVSTNSLAATDAFYVYALSYKYKKRYLKLGFEIHEFKPFPADAGDLVSAYASLGASDTPVHPVKGYQKFGPTPLRRGGVRVGLHAKSMVIDDHIVVIGSHNFDPRSDFYNTESGFIIDDAQLAHAVSAAILRDAQAGNAWVIARQPREQPWRGINNAIADFSAALPLFDFWPFRYATSYELNPGCPPSVPGADDFYACHTDVGDFPEVDLPMKTIYTRTMTAFGAGLISIM